MKCLTIYWTICLQMWLGIVVVSGNDLLSRGRILSEFREISNLKMSFDYPFNNSKHECGIRLAPLPHNIHEWHFSFMGPEESPYSGGCYHGRIVLPPDYPRKAPAISMLSATGRWAIGKDICLSGAIQLVGFV